MKAQPHQVTPLSRAECVHLLGTATVGRLIFTVSGLPAVESVSFTFGDRGIVFEPRTGSRFVAAHTNTVVAFEVDQLDTETGVGWSVTVVGEARLLDGPSGPAPRSTNNGPQEANASMVVLHLGMVTGQRIGA